MCPRLPYFVLSSTGLNQLMSSLLKNINLTTADLLLTLNGCPLRTVLLMIKRSGSTDKTLPVATRD